MRLFGTIETSFHTAHLTPAPKGESARCWFVPLGIKGAGRLRVFKRLFYTGALFLMASFAVSGQRITVSEEIMLKDDLGYDILGNMNGQTLLLRDRGTDYEVRSYDAQMLLRWERTLELEKRSTDMISLIAGENQFHFLYGYRHRGDYIIMHRTYSSELVLMDTMVVHVDEKEYFTPRYKAAVSEDRTKVLLFQAEKENEISTMVYALPEKKLLWSKEIRMQEGSVRRDFRDMLVSNNGDVFIILDQERLSERYHAFDVLFIDAGTRVLRDTEVNLGELLAADVYSVIDNVNHRLFISGLYNERAIGRSKGMYMTTVNMRDMKVQLRTVLFSEEFLQNIYGKEVSANRGLTNFTIQDVALRHDGGALLIAEMTKEYSRRPNVPGRREFGYTRGGWVDYYYEDLIVFALHPDGTEHWNAVLHKKQYSQDDDAMYSSYFLFRTPEMLRLLFNDEIRLENMVSEYVIRGNGYHRRQSVFSTDYQRLRLRLKDAVQISYNECIVPSERNSRLCLVKITFEDKAETVKND